jgi:hypothetical protein
LAKVPRFLAILAVELIGGFGLAGRSVSSGTEACMRKAISYCWMRVWISGSPTSEKEGWLSALRPSSMRGAFRGRRRGVLEVEHRIAERAEGDAGVLAGQETGAPQAGGDRLDVGVGELWVACSTTKVGRSSFIEPRP